MSINIYDPNTGLTPIAGVPTTVINGLKTGKLGDFLVATEQSTYITDDDSSETLKTYWQLDPESELEAYGVSVHDGEMYKVFYDGIYSASRFATKDDISAINTDVSKKTSSQIHCKKTFTENVWNNKTWSGLTSFYGNLIWTDGDNIYYSNGTEQYVLDRSTSTWTTKTWNGLTDFDGKYVWTDGEDIFYSNGSTNSNHYVLDKSTSTWSTKTWGGFWNSNMDGDDVWTDGDNIYYTSYDSTSYVLDKSTSSWSSKRWNVSIFDGKCVWTDGDNIYWSSYYYGPFHYVLNKSTSTWEAKTWTGLTDFYGEYIWFDGENVYYSDLDTGYQYVLDKAASKWITKTWSEVTFINTQNIWAIGDTIYYSNGSTQKVLNSNYATKDDVTSIVNQNITSALSASY